MSYSTVSDYRDVLLKEFVDDTYIADADADIDDLARSLGVSPSRIPSPCPNIVKKLSIAKVYYAVAGDRSMMNAVSSEAGAGKDSYEYKRVYWASEIERLEGLLTPAALVGGKDGLGGGLATKATYPMSFPIYRS